MSLDEIKEAILRLPAREVAELHHWVAELHNRLWDEQIEREADAGRFDDILAELKEEYEAGRTKPL